MFSFAQHFLDLVLNVIDSAAGKDRDKAVDFFYRFIPPFPFKQQSCQLAVKSFADRFGRVSGNNGVWFYVASANANMALRIFVLVVQ